jgi:3-hydroxyacyl-CoA dehydrogenase
LNLVGALSWPDKRLHFELLEGSVTSERVIAFITALTKNAKSGRLSVVVLDNAGFHTSKLVRAARGMTPVFGTS